MIESLSKNMSVKFTSFKPCIPMALFKSLESSIKTTFRKKRIFRWKQAVDVSTIDNTSIKYKNYYDFINNIPINQELESCYLHISLKLEQYACIYISSTRISWTVKSSKHTKSNVLISLLEQSIKQIVSKIEIDENNVGFLNNDEENMVNVTLTTSHDEREYTNKSNRIHLIINALVAFGTVIVTVLLSYFLGLYK